LASTILRPFELISGLAQKLDGLTQVGTDILRIEPPTGFLNSSVKTSGGTMIANFFQDFQFLAGRQTGRGQFGAGKIGIHPFQKIGGDDFVGGFEIIGVVQRTAHIRVLELVPAQVQEVSLHDAGGLSGKISRTTRPSLKSWKVIALCPLA
jgi:hypothetical protein